MIFWCKIIKYLFFAVPSVQDKGHRKHVEGQMKPVLFMGNPTFAVTNVQVDGNPSMVSWASSIAFFHCWIAFDSNAYNLRFQNHIPYAYADPFAGGLYTAYGPPAIVSTVKHFFFFFFSFLFFIMVFLWFCCLVGYSSRNYEATGSPNYLWCIDIWDLICAI